jgi:hypothetical protein
MKLTKTYGKALMCVFSSLALCGAEEIDERPALSICGRDSCGDLVVKIIDGREMPLRVMISHCFYESHAQAMANARARMRKQRVRLRVVELSPQERIVIETVVKAYFKDEERDLTDATQAIRATLNSF